MTAIAVAFDPGLTTGAAVGTLTDGRMYVRASQHKFDHLMLWQQLELLKPDYVISEDFEFRRNSKEGLILYPLELIGVMEIWTALNRKSFTRQKASQGKSYYNNDVLTRDGLYIRGKPHAMDATRHLLHWFTFGFGYQFNASGYEPEAKRLPKLKKLTVYRKPGQ